MSNINLRLYGDQIYPNIEKYLSQYISPDIPKEEFLSSYKNGLLQIKSLKLKEKIQISPQILIEEASIEEIKLHIPNETENLCIEINNMACFLSISELNEDEIEKILIKERKNIIDEFIKYAINKIEKKDGPSFFDNIIKSVIEKIINGYKINIYNIELKIRAINRNNIFFVFNTENADFICDKGINIKNMNLTYHEDLIKKIIFEKFNFNMDLIYANEEQKINNKINIFISDIKLQLNQNIYFEVKNIIDIFEEANYKKIYLLYKKLIQYERPKDNEEGKKNYKLLWNYAINTVKKLQKYVQNDDENIFDLKYLTQHKIIKEYLENNQKDENIILPDIKNALYMTKETVEKKVLENKKGNIFAKSFSFFFGAKEEDKKDELTEEETEISSDIYNYDNIFKYLKEKSNINVDSFSSIISKIKNFFCDFSAEINFEKLELILQNYSSETQNLFIKGMKTNFDFFNKEFEFGLFINDIGYEKDKSFCDKNDIFCNDVISLTRTKQNFINLNFGFKNIELKEELFIFLMSFVKSINNDKKIRLFHEKKIIKEEIINNSQKEEMIENLKNFSFINNFKLSNIPSFSLKSKENKIDFIISNYSITENSINITLNIKDSYSTILNNFIFNPKKENNQFIFHLDSPLELQLSNKSSKNFFLNYLKFKKELSLYDDKKRNNEIKKEEKYLFGFNYKSYTNIDLTNYNMNEYMIDIIMKKIDIKIFEENENHESNLLLEDFIFLYKNKNLEINLNKFIISTNLMSTIVLYLIDFESPLLDNYKNQANFRAKDANDIITMISGIENQTSNELNQKTELKIEKGINYSKLLENILDKFVFNLNIFSFIYKSNDFILSANFNKINVYKKKEAEDKISLYSSIENWNLSMISPKINIKQKNIIENNQKTLISYGLKDEVIKGDLKSIYLNSNMIEILDIWENTKFLLNQVNWDIILCKMYFNVDDFIVVFDQFKYCISKILLFNFKENCAKENAVYLKILDFIMFNQNKNKLIYEKEIDIDYLFTSSTENDISIKFNNANIKISQHDIAFLSSCIKIPEKNDKTQDELLKRRATFVPNTSSIKSKTGNKIDLLNFEENNFSSNSSNQIQNRISFTDQYSQKKKKFSLSLNIDIPVLNLCFCLNDNYTKIEEISLESSNMKLKNIFYENILSHQITSELTYTLLLGKLNFAFFYDKDNFINILSKRKTELKPNDSNKANIENIIKEETETKDINSNQVEIKYDKNGYTININKNEINIRIDAFIMIYYYFKGAIPLKEMIDNLEQVDLNINNKKKYFQLQINFNESEFQLSTSFSGKENLFLDIEKFIIIYTGNKSLPYGNYLINLYQLSSKIVVKNNIRELFFTSYYFLQIKITFLEELFSAIIDMDKLTINLSYRDLISFLRAYLINFRMLDNAIKKGENFLKNKDQGKQDEIISIKKEKSENKKMNNNINNKNSNSSTPTGFINKKLVFSGELNFEKLDITLIDNSKGSYHPFLNIINNKIYLVLNPDKSIETSFSFQLFSYNYIACIWEPTIENTIIKFSNIYTKGSIDVTNKYKAEINNININLSDMAISFTLLTLNNWIDKFEKKKKKFQFEKINNKQFITKQEPNEVSKITNNQVINYTGVEFKIIHNGKMIVCPPIKPVELDYIKQSNKKEKILNYITLIYDEDHKFEIPLEKIVRLRHTINNDISFISDSCISENRTINIFLYSTIIFKNKSIYPLQIKISNQSNELAFLVSNPNSIVGIPLNLINKKNNFNFMLIKTKKKENSNNDYSQNFNIGSIQDLDTDTEYKDMIRFKKRYLYMKLDHSISNVRTLLINAAYSIINCLPCDITLHFSQKKEVIKKCSQYYIDEYFGSKLFIAFSINTGIEHFVSEGFDILSLGLKKTEEKFLTFSKNNYVINIPYEFKQNEEENTLIIYSEYILYNNSGIVLSVHSRDNEKKMLCFSVEKNISLITSKFDYKEAYIQLLNDKYISKKVKLSSLIEKSPYSEITMLNETGDRLDFNIKKNFSYINIVNNPNFKDNIMSVVFTIFPKCIITNLLPNKRFLICDYNFQDNKQVIYPYDKSNFNFFGHGVNAQLGISVINMTTNKCTHLIKFKFEIGVYTLSTFEETFNLEIRKNPSNGCIDVFVIPNDLENSKIIMENLCGEAINIYQKNYEKYMQILENNEVQTLKIYNYDLPIFTIETSNSVFDLKFDKMEEKETSITLNQKIVLLIQANGIKMKLIFYSKAKYNQLKNIIYTNSYEIRISSILISIIGDNEFQDTKLSNYNRYEILVLFLSDIFMNLTVEKTSSLLDKDNMRIIFNLTNFQIHNQVSEKGKFPCILSNNEKDAFISSYTEFDYYQKLKIIKMNNNQIVISKMLLGIDPQFFIDLIDFFGNILYRMNITNFSVHEIFEIKKEEENEQDKINMLIKKYDQSKILINAKTFEIPGINIKFELTNVGIKDLLKKRIGCSEFYYWLAKGLVGRSHTLALEPSKFPYNNGGVSHFFKGIFYHIRGKFVNKLTDIGLKGFIGKFKNMFTYDDSNLNNVSNNRYRNKRIFYGKFKFFKEYDKSDAYLINGFFDKYKYLRNKYYPIYIVSGFKKFYLFTNLSMFIVKYTDFVYLNVIDYFYIKKVAFDKLKINIEYNQVIDSADKCDIECENENITENVAKILNEQILSNKEKIYEV